MELENSDICSKLKKTKSLVIRFRLELCSFKFSARRLGINLTPSLVTLSLCRAQF